MGENGEDRRGETARGPGEDADFYHAKGVTAAFYFDRILPQVGSLLFAIKSGKGSMMALAEAAF